jgi:hypothetical protein
MFDSETTALLRAVLELSLRLPIFRPFALVLVRLAHDRRFVVAILFFVLFIIFVVVRIARRHRISHHCEEWPADEI